MRLTAAAPVTWPAPHLVDQWWRDAVAPLAATYVDARGRVVDPEDPDDTSGPDYVRLVRGTHLAPGAAYVLESPSLEGVDLTAEVIGEVARRSVRLRLQGRRGMLGLGPAPVTEVHLDGLDHLAGVDATSTNPYLAGSLQVRPDPAGLVRMQLRLRWLSVDLEVRVLPRTAGPDPDADLTAHLHLAARGAWSLAVAPVVAVLGRWGRELMDEAVVEWAASLTALAEGRASVSLEQRRARAQAERDRRRHEKNALWVRNEASRRFHEVQGRIERESWWGQRAGAWRRAYAELPPVTWPDRATSTHPAPWEEAVDAAVVQLSRTRRSARRARIEPELDRLTLAELAGRRELVTPDTTPLLRAEDLELRWLRSPLSTWAHLRRTVGLTDEEARAMPGGAQDPPDDESPDGDP